MKISNRLFNDQQIRQFSQNMEDIQRLQGKISSGKNILFASDDPVGAVELSGVCRKCLLKLNKRSSFLI